MEALRLGHEPTVALQALSAGLNAAQIIALPMRPWEHAIVLGVSAALATLANRALVTPVARSTSAPEPWETQPK